MISQDHTNTQILEAILYLGWTYLRCLQFLKWSSHLIATCLTFKDECAVSEFYSFRIVGRATAPWLTWIIQSPTPQFYLGSWGWCPDWPVLFNRVHDPDQLGLQASSLLVSLLERDTSRPFLPMDKRTGHYSAIWSALHLSICPCVCSTCGKARVRHRHYSPKLGIIWHSMHNANIYNKTLTKLKIKRNSIQIFTLCLSQTQFLAKGPYQHKQHWDSTTQRSCHQ